MTDPFILLDLLSELGSVKVAVTIVVTPAYSDSFFCYILRTNSGKRFSTYAISSYYFCINVMSSYYFYMNICAICNYIRITI